MADVSWATKEWYDQRIEIIAGNVAASVAYRNAVPDESKREALEDKGVIEFAITGFLTEFVRQTQLGIPNLNPESRQRNETHYSQSDAGLAHLEASAQKMKECGLDRQQVMRILPHIITACTSHYFEFPPTQYSHAEWNRDAQASVMRDMKRFDSLLDRLYPGRNTSNLLA